MKKILFAQMIIIGIAIAVASVPSVAKYAQYPNPGTVNDINNPRPDSPFHFTPFAPTYEERKELALRHTAEKSPGSLHGEVARAMLGEPGSLNDSEVEYIEKRLGEREDCADFTAIRAVIALYVNQIHPFLTDEQRERIKKTLLDFKFWVDEPGQNRMIFWTENHQMVFHSSEYLTGQMFKEDVFTNNGENGAWHMEHARKKILTWLERRMRWGFSEWDSNVYYDEDMVGLIAVAEFSEDEDLSLAASIVTDLMLFDMVSDMFKGVYGTSHGRAYDQDIMSGRDYAVKGILSIVTGLGPADGVGHMSALSLAVTRKYSPPDIIIRIGQEDPDDYANYERHGIPLEKIKEYGISRSDVNDAPVLWGMGAHTQPMVIDLFLKAADQFQLWTHPFIEDAADAASALPRDGSVGKMRKSWVLESDRTLLGEVNKLSYRTRDYMISAAQSYRPGEMGNQHHIWQATLSPDAIVFTTNPASLKVHDGHTPSYWAGQNRLPRVGLYKNVAVIMYKIIMKQAMGERDIFQFTHAFFPRWAFNEVREEKGWIFGKAGTGYVALYSAQPYEWKDSDYDFSHDVIADGKRNIWICQMGSSADGSFDEFINGILAAKLEVDAEGLQATFDSPGNGEVKFSWEGDLTVGGNVIPLDGYKRVQNPNAISEFDSGVYEITQGGEKLTLDFFKRIRKVEKVAGN